MGSVTISWNISSYVMENIDVSNGFERYPEIRVKTLVKFAS